MCVALDGQILWNSALRELNSGLQSNYSRITNWHTNARGYLWISLLTLITITISSYVLTKWTYQLVHAWLNNNNVTCMIWYITREVLLPYIANQICLACMTLSDDVAMQHNSILQANIISCILKRKSVLQSASWEFFLHSHSGVDRVLHQTTSWGKYNLALHQNGLRSV